MTTAPADGQASIGPPRIPPAKYWSLSPTYNHWVKLSAHDIVHTLHQPPAFAGQPVLFFNNCPIRYAYVVGVILSIEAFNETTAVILLDDSSGACIEVVLRGKVEVPGLTRTADGLGLVLDGKSLAPGVVLKAKGTFTSFRGVRQIELRRVAVVGCTRDEVAAWKARAAARKELERGWVLSAAEMEALDAEIARADKLAVEQEGQRRAKKQERERTRGERETRRETRRQKQERAMDAGALI